MIEGIFERQVACRLPAAYPADAETYALLMEHARRRQSAALRRLLAGTGMTFVELADAVNASAGAELVSEATLRNMRAGTSVMPPLAAVALAAVVGRDPVELLPHLEAFPWLGGRYRPALAGRPWGEIASRFDVPLAAVAPAFRSDAGPSSAEAYGHDDDDGRDDDRVGPDPSSCPSGGIAIPDIIDAIARKVSERDACADAGVPHRGRGPVHDAVPAPPPVPSSESHDDVPERHHVLMSLSDEPGGVRLTYRGLMDLDRLRMVRDAVGEDAWSAEGAFALGRVPGRSDPLIVCDMLVPRARVPRLLSAIGAPLRRRGLLARLFGRR